MCGEKFAFFVAKTLKMGSPPHVRGKVVGSEELPGVVGITPAYAGKRIKLRKRHSICGEKMDSSGSAAMM